jgi:hypothetical protein
LVVAFECDGEGSGLGEGLVGDGVVGPASEGVGGDGHVSAADRLAVGIGEVYPMAASGRGR